MIVKVNTILCANVDGTNAATLNLYIDGVGTTVTGVTGTALATSIYLAKTVSVPADDILVAKRRWQVPYWDLGVNVDDIRNQDKEVDGRIALNDRPFVDDINVDKVEAGIIVL